MIGISRAHASDSKEQQAAEGFILNALCEKLGVKLAPQSLSLPSGSTVQLDGVNESARVICEVFARQGKLKPAQSKKVASDFLKMLLVEKSLGGTWNKHFCFASEEAAAQAKGKSWLANVAKEFGIKVHVIELPQSEVNSVLAAQKRQKMVNAVSVPKYIED